MTACVGGAPGSAPQLTRMTTKQVESLSMIARHPVFLVLVGMVLTVLMLAVPALQVLAVGFLLGAVR
jgi:hypothetical protein